MNRFGRSGALLGSCLLIAKLMLTGQIHYYLSPTYDGLTVATGLVLAAMGGLELWHAFGSTRAQHTPAGLEDRLTLALVAVPLVAGLLLTPRALGASGLGGTSVSRLVLAFEGAPAGSLSTPPPPRRPIVDVGDLIAYLHQAGEGGVGQHIRALGLVRHGDDLRSNEFVLIRYAIVHCVADAQPLGLLVVAPDGSYVHDDLWVEVEGTLSAQPRGADRLVGIEALRVVPTEEPADPYVQAG